MRDVVFTRENFRQDIVKTDEDAPWYRDFRVQTVVLFVLTLVIVGVFWI